MISNVEVSRKEFVEFLTSGYVIYFFSEKLIGHLNDNLLSESSFALEYDYDDEGFYRVQNWEREAPVKVGFFPAENGEAFLVRAFRKHTDRSEKEIASLLLNIFKTLKWWKEWP